MEHRGVVIIDARKKRENNLKQFLVAFLVIMLGAFASPAANAACTSDQIDVAGDGSNCQTAKFSLTTTSLSANDTFGFYMSAMGTFYVDCGDDGTLSGDGVSGDTITRTGTTETLYTCTYSTGGVKTIRMGGVATGWYRSSTQQVAVIKFYNVDYHSEEKIASVYGDLSAMFPYLSGNSNDTSLPNFFLTFNGAQNLSEIPGTLFGSYNNIQGTYYMFSYTFARSGLTSIPENLFSSVKNFVAGGMFEGAFYACDLLTSLPDNLFSGITGADWFVFSNTFHDCSRLTHIPNNLFANITYAANYAFQNTFAHTGITAIPSEIFSGLTQVGSNAFGGTFAKCYNVTGYIPPSAFAGLIANGSTYANNMWLSTFDDTNLATTCPAGMTQYITGYEDYWGGHVSCRVTASQTCAAGTYLPAAYNECTACAAGSYCTGGTYDFNASASQGIAACAAGLYSPAGMSNANQCGHILHFGDATLYLHGVKKTTPAMHVRVGNDIFYGNMTTADVPMNVGTTQKLKVKYGGVTYSIYDDTVNVN